MPNITEAHNTHLSPPILITIIVIAGFPVLVNIAYIIVCFRTLRKKLHNLLVLSLCISDNFLAISIQGYCMIILVDSLKAHVKLCLLQTFAVCYGLVSSYGLILVICLERYVTVKAMNFGILKTLDRFKYLIIGGTLSLGFMFTIETILFTPHETHMSSCSIPNLYGNQYHFFITLMVGTLTGISMFILIVTLSTSYHIWRLFYKRNKVHSSNQEIKDFHQTELLPNKSTEKRDNEINMCQGDSSITSDMKNKIYQNHNVVDAVTKCGTTNASTTNFSEHNSSEILNEQDDFNSIYEGETKANSSNIRVQQLIMQMKRERLNSFTYDNAEIKTKRTDKSKKKPLSFDAWEFRAFITSIFIGLSSICFTGPLLVSYWIDLYTGKLMPQQSRMLLSTPLVLNAILNPFIYAWRIPEIRLEFRKIFCKLNS